MQPALVVDANRPLVSRLAGFLVLREREIVGDEVELQKQFFRKSDEASQQEQPEYCCSQLMLAAVDDRKRHYEYIHKSCYPIEKC